MQTKEQFEGINDDSSSESPLENDMTAMLVAEQKKNQAVELDDNEAYRDLTNVHDPVEDWEPTCKALQVAIRSLNDLTKTRIQHFYPKEYADTMSVLRQAFDNFENNSLLVTGRAKQLLHSLMLQVERDIRLEYMERGEEANLQVIKVNATLNNSENKFQAKFCEALGLSSSGSNQLTSVEMVEKVQEYFADQENLKVLFILEDIDYYVETTKQIMLYKILDTLMATSQIRFVFLCTSQKYDVVDAFEKRIKSRFSHRQSLMYNSNLVLFKQQVKEMLVEKFELEPFEDDAKNGIYKGVILKLSEFVDSGKAEDALTTAWQ